MQPVPLLQAFDTSACLQTLAEAEQDAQKYVDVYKRQEYKDGEFKAEFDEVVNALREKDGLLCSRASMVNRL